MVTFNPPTSLGSGAYLITWSSDQVSPTYRVYLDGVLVSTQTVASSVLRAEGTAPILEILDVPDDVAADAFPDHFTLGWITSTNTSRYRIEKYSNGAWTATATVAASSDPWQSWSTPRQDDETSVQWRIVPIDSAGNDGTATAFTETMVRNPDIPSVSFAWNGSGSNTVTVTAA